MDDLSSSDKRNDYARCLCILYESALVVGGIDHKRYYAAYDTEVYLSYSLRFYWQREVSNLKERILLITEPSLFFYRKEKTMVITITWWMILGDILGTIFAFFLILDFDLDWIRSQKTISFKVEDLSKKTQSL